MAHIAGPRAVSSEKHGMLTREKVVKMFMRRVRSIIRLRRMARDPRYGSPETLLRTALCTEDDLFATAGLHMPNVEDLEEALVNVCLETPEGSDTARWLVRLIDRVSVHLRMFE